MQNDDLCLIAQVSWRNFFSLGLSGLRCGAGYRPEQIANHRRDQECYASFLGGLVRRLELTHCLQSSSA